MFLFLFFSSWKNLFIINLYVDIYRKKGNYDEAQELYLEALKHAESIHGQNHPSVADTMNNLGILLKKQGKYNEALDYLKQALKFWLWRHISKVSMNFHNDLISHFGFEPGSVFFNPL